MKLDIEADRIGTYFIFSSVVVAFWFISIEALWYPVIMPIIFSIDWFPIPDSFKFQLVGFLSTFTGMLLTHLKKK